MEKKQISDIGSFKRETKPFALIVTFVVNLLYNHIQNQEVTICHT